MEFQIYAIKDISIHALREEGDSVPTLRTPARSAISIHALREEGDSFPCSWG